MRVLHSRGQNKLQTKLNSEKYEQTKHYSETNSELPQRLDKALNNTTVEQRRGLADFLETL